MSQRRPDPLKLLPQARAFLSAVELDTPSMTDDLTLLEQQLANRPFAQLELSFQRFADFDHYNVFPTAFCQGLKALFS